MNHGGWGGLRLGLGSGLGLKLGLGLGLGIFSGSRLEFGSGMGLGLTSCSRGRLFLELGVLGGDVGARLCKLSVELSGGAQQLAPTSKMHLHHGGVGLVSGVGLAIIGVGVSVGAGVAKLVSITTGGTLVVAGVKTKMTSKNLLKE